MRFKKGWYEPTLLKGNILSYCQGLIQAFVVPKTKYWFDFWLPKFSNEGERDREREQRKGPHQILLKYSCASKLREMSSRIHVYHFKKVTFTWVDFNSYLWHWAPPKATFAVMMMRNRWKLSRQLIPRLRTKPVLFFSMLCNSVNLDYRKPAYLSPPPFLLHHDKIFCLHARFTNVTGRAPQLYTILTTYTTCLWLHRVAQIGI